MTISMHGVGPAEPAIWPHLPLTFATLMSALRSGDLAGARQAYDELLQGVQPHVGSLIAPVGAALGAGDVAQAGRKLGELRGDLASVSRAAPGLVPSASTAPPAPAIPDPTRAASRALGWLV